jgi:hypothetical protein
MGLTSFAKSTFASANCGTKNVKDATPRTTSEKLFFIQIETRTFLTADFSKSTLHRNQTEKGVADSKLFQIGGWFQREHSPTCRSKGSGKRSSATLF